MSKEMELELKSRRVLVVGLGKSGLASANFLADRGAQVTVSDSRTELQLQREIETLWKHNIAVETGRHGDQTFREQDLIVVSPGVPFDLPQLQSARAAGISVIGEVELAARFLRGKLVTITGANGKTTTTSLTGEIFEKSGFHTLVGGNIGTPVISLVAKSSPETVVVLEVSSFQLETIASFRPKIAAILNITPDHLDRHGSLENYVSAKARIFENQTAGDFTILNADNDLAAGLAARSKGQVFFFSRKSEIAQGAFVRNQEIFFRDDKNVTGIMPVLEIPLKGAHNVENVLAAVSIAFLGGCAPQQIRKAVAEFHAVEHRLELIAKIDGVEYYNDSKATNVDATIKALESFPGGIHLILGGKDKDSDYATMNTLLRERVKTVYTIGAAAEKIRRHIAGATHIEDAGTLANAVQSASNHATAGDVVLLAPACSSFDQFENYEHRGRVFKELVAQLKQQHEKTADIRSIESPAIEGARK